MELQLLLSTFHCDKGRDLEGIEPWGITIGNNKSLPWNAHPYLDNFIRAGSAVTAKLLR